MTRPYLPATIPADLVDVVLDALQRGRTALAERTASSA